MADRHAVGVEAPAWTARLRVWHLVALLVVQFLIPLLVSVGLMVYWPERFQPDTMFTPQFVIMFELAGLLLPTWLLLRWRGVRLAELEPRPVPTAAMLVGTVLLIVPLTMLLNVANQILFTHLPGAIQNFNPVAALLEEVQVERWDQWVVLVLAMVLVPALCEEIAYRGVIQPVLIRRLGGAGGVAATTLIFALFHFDPARATVHICLGMVFGYLALRTGSLFVPFLAHALANGAALFVVNGLEALPLLPWILLGLGGVAALAFVWLAGTPPGGRLVPATAAALMVLAVLDASAVGQSSVVMLVRAQTLLDQGRYEAAILAFERSIALNPVYAPPYHHLANLYVSGHGGRRPAEAVRLASMAVQLTNRRNIKFLDTLAKAYLKEQNYSQALQVWRETLDLKPGYRRAEAGLRQAQQELSRSQAKR